MKKYQNFLSENFHFVGGKISVYLNRHVFVMDTLGTLFKGGNFCVFLFGFLRANPFPGRQYSFVEFDHEIFSIVILSL